MQEQYIKTTIFWKNEQQLSTKIYTRKVLGAGRAATASLVKVSTKGKGSFECVEKCFRPGLLTRFIYWCFFQSPFPYQHDRNAISAAFYRRAVAGKILSAFNQGDNLVAEPLYTRWDAQNCAFVLGARFVDGRGIIPQEVDHLWIRRGIYNYLVRPLARLFGKKLSRKSPPPEEVKQLLHLMRRLEQTFKSSGLIGTGWQTSPKALVSTANLLRTDNGYVLVDLESGIPAVLVPYYLIRSISSLRFPYFDDLEPKVLQHFLENNRLQLTDYLSEEGFETLLCDVEELKNCTERWKKGEIAAFRNLPSLLFGQAKRQAVKEARAEAWLRENIIDDESFVKLSRSRRLFTEPLFLLGVLPGKLGLTLRRVGGNRTYRAKVHQFFTDREKRKQWLQEFADERFRRWIDQGRFPPTENSSLTLFGQRFLWHYVASKITPPHFHRFFIDGEFRKGILIRIGLFLTSDRYQLEYSRYLIHKALLEWKMDGRIEDKELRNLVKEINNNSIQEYIRVFGLHVALKFFEPVTTGIKVVGAGWYLSTFATQFPILDPTAPLSINLLVAFVHAAVTNPISILMLVNTSLWRTLITLQRMLSIKRRHISYSTALFFGMIPALGTLAYPVQIYARCRDLSIFLMRHILGKVGQNLPIYGGKNSLTELWMIKSINLIVEFMEIVRWVWNLSMGPLIALVPYKKKHAMANPPEVVQNGRERGRWTHLVDERVKEMWSRLEEFV